MAQQNNAGLCFRKEAMLFGFESKNVFSLCTIRLFGFQANSLMWEILNSYPYKLLQGHGVISPLAKGDPLSPSCSCRANAGCSLISSSGFDSTLVALGSPRLASKLLQLPNIIFCKRVFLNPTNRTFGLCPNPLVL